MGNRSFLKIVSFAVLIHCAIATAVKYVPFRRQIEADFDQLITSNISSDEDDLLRVKYHLTNSSQVVRMWVHSKNATVENPLLVSVRERKAVLSWQVPLGLDNKFFYSAVSRTLCPQNFTDLALHRNASYPSENSTLFVELSCSNPQPVNFEIKASIVSDFILGLNEHKFFNVSPSQPQFFGFLVPEGIESVGINVRSGDQKCLIVSVQDTECPVFDLDANVLSTGTYQTMTTKSSIVIRRSQFAQFFIVFVLIPDDFSCTGISNIIPSGDEILDVSRIKTVEVWIEKTAGTWDYVIAISVTLSAFVGFYLISFFFWGLFVYRDARDPKLLEAKRVVLESLATGETSPLIQSGAVNGRMQGKNTSYGSINRQPDSGSDADHPVPHSGVEGAGPSGSGPQRRVERPAVASGLGPERQGDRPAVDADVERQQSDGTLDEYDCVPDAAVDKSVVRIKARLMLSDLAQKPYKRLNLKYNMYHWNLITIAIFYVLPVIQLVITNQTVVRNTGNEDLCYYNFECARPLGPLFAFNTVFSNIGYVLLGILFLIMVMIRDKRHQMRMKENELLETKFGIPRHYGLFYSMGIALVMEGVLSASYHICPNYTNFQFDSAFMYMIAALCLLKIYQIRHPDINAHSHVSYAVMAMIILIAVVGVVYNDLAFWIVFSVSYVLLMFMISAEFYYKSQWKIDRFVFQRIRLEWCSGQGCRKILPSYPDRMIYLVICNGMNLGFIIWGLIEQPKAFAGYLVVVFISNLMLYLSFYVLMKLRHRERLKRRVIILGVMALAAWGGSSAFFLQERISWMKTPSKSRELNDGCILLGFYDTHDIWHFLSATSLFLSFMLTLLMDDDLMYTAHDKIVVF